MSTLDRAFLSALLGIGGLIVVILIRGDRTVPQVDQFNYHQQTISPFKAQLHFTFNREMDKASVEQGFRITPETSGRFSWLGRKMAFTPSLPLPYNTQFQIEIRDALDANGIALPVTYQSQFSTTEQRLVYLGSEGEERLRLVLWKSQSQTRQILTPPHLMVLEHQPSQDGQTLYFSATDKNNIDPTFHWTSLQQVFSLHLPTQELKLVADNKGVINYGFVVSEDQRTVVLARLDRHAPDIEDPFSLWFKSSDQSQWQPLPQQGIVDVPFFLSPDAYQVLGPGSSGFVLIPLAAQATPQYVGSFTHAYGFSPNGQKLLFTKTSRQDDFTQYSHLIVLGADGSKHTALQNYGVLDHLRFGPQGETIYFVMTQGKQDVSMSLPFHLYAYHLPSQSLRPLTQDPEWSEEAFHISQDGQRIVYERYPTLEEDNLGPEFRDTLERTGEDLSNAELWVFEIESQSNNPLHLKGRKPQWLP